MSEEEDPKFEIVQGIGRIEYHGSRAPHCSHSEWTEGRGER